MLYDNIKDLVNAVTGDLGNANGCVVWRGQVNGEWKAYPGLYRRLLYNGYQPEEITEGLVDRYETDLFSEANGLGYYGEVGGNRLDLMVELQHLGAATRMLDVTFDPFIALWFASDDRSKNGVVFRYEIDPRCVATYDVVSTWSTITKDSLRGMPVLFCPAKTNERIKAQSSAFLMTVLSKSLADGSIFSSNTDSISVKRFDFLGTMKHEIREYLANVRNMGQYDIFPDLQGYAAANSATQLFPRKLENMYTGEDGLFPKEFTI